MNSRHLIVMIACSIIPAMAVCGARPSPTSGQSQEGVVSGVVVIKFAQGVSIPGGSLSKSAGTLARVLAENGVKKLSPAFKSVHPLNPDRIAAGFVDLSRICVATIASGRNPIAVARRIAARRDVEYAEPMYRNHLDDVPNDPYYASIQTAYLALMNAPAGWSIAKGDATVVIADVDGGTYWRHADLMENLWINPAEDINHNGQYDPTPSGSGGDLDGIDQDGDGYVDDVIGWNFSNNTGDPTGLGSTPSSATHGSLTASDFGAVTNNGSGMAGSSWNCSVMPICTADPANDNSILYGYQGIVFAATHGARVINCSWGRSGRASLFEQDVITAATQAGALVVASAGNNGTNNDLFPQFPATYRHVLSVGATNTSTDQIASFSCYGTNVGAFAPGVNILGAANGDGLYAQESGTSFSSPLVAGLAGILASQHMTWTPDQVALQIRLTADSIDGANPALAGSLGRGRVNFGRALSESHPGIVIDSVIVRAPQGRRFLLPGDTVYLGLLARNILPQTAANVAFSVSTTDGSLQVLQGSGGVADPIPQGMQVQIPDFSFLVGPVAAAHVAPIRITWVSDPLTRDAMTTTLSVFPSMPLWLVQSSPTGTELFSVCAVDRNTVWAAGGDGNATGPVVVRTVDGGATWKDVTGNLAGIDGFSVAANDSLRAWVGTGNGKIYATTDGGMTWGQQTYPGTQSGFIDGIRFFDQNTGFALGDPPSTSSGTFVLLKTTNGGATWSHLANEPVGAVGLAGWVNSFWWTDQNHGWFGSDNVVWRTTDGGTSWSTGATAAGSNYGLAFIDNLHGIVGQSTGAIQRTSDGGATWLNVTSPTNNPIVGVWAGSGYAWIADPSVPYRSTDFGMSWATQLPEPYFGGIDHFAMADTGTGWAVTSGGDILRYSSVGPAAVASPGPGVLPASYSLEQNYPNPFNPRTEVRYHLPVVSNVRLAIYDLLGREVATLVNEVKSPGTYEIPFDGSALASGVYFCRMQARESPGGRGGSGSTFVATKRMLLLK